MRAGIVKASHEYKWSSAKKRVYKGHDPVLSNDCFLDREIMDWATYLMGNDDKKLIDKIRESTKAGRPCGNEAFVTKLEGLLGRTLKANPRGRPCVGK